MATIDNLEIEIIGSSSKAEKAIDRLVDKLDTLNQSLGNINSNGLKSFANSLDTLSSAMARFKDAKVTASTFNGVAEGINKFSKIDSAKLSQVGTSLSGLSASLQALSGTTINTDGLSEFIAALSKLGEKSATQATTNLPLISKDLKQFITDLNGIQNVNFDVGSLASLIQSLRTLGHQTVTQATVNLPNISRDLKQFITDLNSIGALNFDMTNLSSLVSAISRLGSVASGRAITNLPLLADALKDLFTTLSTAPNVSQNIIDMVNALAQLASAGSRAGTAVNSLGRSFNSYNSVTKKTTTTTKGIASAIGKFYARCWLLIRAVKALGNAVKSTSDYVEAFNYFSVAFNKIGTDWGQQFAQYGYSNAEEYAKSFSSRMQDDLSKLSGIKFDTNNMRLTNNEMKNLGMSIKQTTQYAAELAGVFNSAGLTGEATYAASSALTKLAADYSSLINVDYETAAQNFRSGLTGQSETLYKYGLDVTDARLKTEAYALGITKSVANMTQAEKMQLRMISILKQSKIAWGDLANTINQPANQMRVLKTQVQELSMLFGQLFIPVLSKVIPVITGVVIALKRLMSAIAGIIGVKLGDSKDYAADFSNISSGANDVSNSLNNVASSAKKAKAGLRGFDELNVINMSDTSSSAYSGMGSLDLTDEILAATAEYEKVWQDAFNNMQNIAEKWADKIGVIFEPLKNMFTNISLGNYEQAGNDFSDFWVNIINSLTTMIENIPWAELGQNFGLFLKGISWSDLWKALVNLTEKLIAGLKTLWSEAFKAAPFETALLTALIAVRLPIFKPILNTIGKYIGTKLMGFVAEHLTFSKVAEVFGAGLQAMVGGSAGKSALAFLDSITVKITGIGSIIGGLGLAVINFIDMWKNGWSILGEILKDLGIAIAAVGAVILGVLEGPIALIVAAVTMAVSSIAILVHNNWDEICDMFSRGVQWLKDLFIGLWESVKLAAISSVNHQIQKFENMLNLIVTGLNYLISGINKVIVGAGNLVGKSWNGIPTVPKVTLPKIQTYATGGFPKTADLFYANENGIPELVGTMGGRTAVTSGTEITGIADAVYSTGQTEANLLKTAVGLLEVIAEKEYGISSDTLFKSVQKSARTYTQRTGRTAFA